MTTAQKRTGNFDFHVQVVECTNCGAPVTAPPEGGQVVCEYCDVTLNIAVRPSPPEPSRDKPPPPRDRLTRLRQQLADAAHENPFDPDENAPPELAHYKNKSFFPGKVRSTVLPDLRQRWEQSTAALRQHPDDEEQQLRVYWLADKLARFYGGLGGLTRSVDEARDYHLRRRASLETACGLLSQTPYGYVIRCELARAASWSGEIAAARDWLSQCEPEPDSVNLDTEHRLARGAIKVAEEDWAGILEMLGHDDKAIPLSGKSNQSLATGMRIHALEMQGDHAAAYQQLGDAMKRQGGAVLLTKMRGLKLAPRSSARKRRYGRLVLGAVALVVVGIIVTLILVL